MSRNMMTGIKRLNMRKVRLKRGLTLLDVSKETHYSYCTIGRAERGTLYSGKKKDVRRDEFWKTMSEFYGIPEEKLKEGED